MTEPIWGYDISSPSFKVLRLGDDISSIKQMFASILFRDTGIKGVIAKISNLEENLKAQLILLIDENLVIEKEFNNTREGEISFLLEKTVFPQRKVEVILKVQNGKMSVFSTSVGTGMGFILKKNEEDYYPSSNFSIGVLI